MIFYGSSVRKNVKLPKAYSDYEDDTLQMAGNFILDTDGNLALVHKSQNPADRPSVQDILEFLTKL